MDDLSHAGGESQSVSSYLTTTEKMHGTKRKSLVPWVKKRLSFKNQSRRCNFERPGLVLFSQRVVVAKTLSSLMEHRDALTMTSLEGWVTDPNGILPDSVVHKISQDGGDQPPWLTEVFFELSALDFCQEDKTCCQYLLNFYTHPRNVQDRKTGAAPDSIPVPGDYRGDSFEDDCPKSRRLVQGKGYQPCQPSATVPNTLVKMCSVRADRRCSKSRCISTKLVCGGDLQDHFDMLIENIFKGAFLAQRKILATFFKNDTIPIQVSKEKFARNLYNGPVVMSHSVELFPDNTTDKKSASAEVPLDKNHSSRPSLSQHVKTKGSLNTRRPTGSAADAEQTCAHLQSGLLSITNQTSDCVRGEVIAHATSDFPGRQPVSNLLVFPNGTSVPTAADFDASILVASYWRPETFVANLTDERQELVARENGWWSAGEAALDLERSQADAPKTERVMVFEQSSDNPMPCGPVGVSCEKSDRKPSHVCDGNKALCRLDGVKCDKFVNHRCDANSALCRLDGIRCERSQKPIAVSMVKATLDRLETDNSEREGNHVYCRTESLSLSHETCSGMVDHVCVMNGSFITQGDVTSGNNFRHAHDTFEHRGWHTKHKHRETTAACCQGNVVSLEFGAKKLQRQPSVVFCEEMKTADCRCGGHRLPGCPDRTTCPGLVRHPPALGDNQSSGFLTGCKQVVQFSAEPSTVENTNEPLDRQKTVGKSRLRLLCCGQTRDRDCNG